MAVLQHRELGVREEVFEESGSDMPHWSEADATALFEDMQLALHKLVRKYEVREDDLRSSLDVISKLWEMMAESLAAYDALDNYKVKLEERWQAEKTKRRQLERRKADLESKFDEERFMWQNDRQRLESEKAAVETKLKQTRERNMELVEEVHEQAVKLRQDQITRNDLLEQYKKQYEFARTSSLRRRKNKKQERIPSHLDFSPPSVRPHRSLPTTPYAKAKESRDSTTSQNSHQSKSPIGSLRGDMPLSPTNQSDPWSRNNISLKTEMSHKKGARGVSNKREVGTQMSVEISDDTVEPIMEEEFQYDREGEELLPEEDDPSFAMSLQQELLAVSPDLLAPAATELEMLRREKQQQAKEMKRLQLKKDTIREQKERVESENAQLVVQVEQLKKLLAEQQDQLTEMRQERDEILETYLEQPFDVYCVTKKELHEVLKKLHHTQMEVQRQADEKNILELQLARRKKKSAFKKFADKVKTMFRRQKEETVAVRPTEKSAIDLDLGPFATYKPNAADEILSLEGFNSDQGWLVHCNGMIPPASLPVLYSQLTLKEYHVTEMINCIARGRVYFSSVSQSPMSSKRRMSLLPLAARTQRGQLCVEVWVSSSEESANFIEVIDVLAKVVKYRFLIKGSTYACCMQQIPGRLPDNLRQTLQHQETRETRSGIDFSPNYHHKKVQEDSFSSSDGHLLTKQGPHILSPSVSSSAQTSESGDRDTSYVVITTPTSIGETTSSSAGTSPVRDESLLPKMVPSIVPSSEDEAQNQTEEKNMGDKEESDDAIFRNKMEQSEESRQHRRGGWRTSTPKYGRLSSVSGCNKSSSLSVEPEALMWVATDNKRLQFYSLIGSNHHKPMRQIELPEKPHCLEYCDGKVFLGLAEGKMLVFHTESIGIESWDIDNPVPIDLPSSLPEETFPVSCVTVVRDNVWVGAGPHLYLLEKHTFSRTGVRFLDGYKYHLKQFMYNGDVVLVSIMHGSEIFVLTSDKAVTIKKIDFNHICLLLDRPVTPVDGTEDYHLLDIIHMMSAQDLLYVTTSTGKIITMPLASLSSKRPNEGDTESESSQSSKSGSFPVIDRPDMYKLRTMASISLDNHREAVRGIVHISLPEHMSSTLSSSVLNLSDNSSLAPATSLPNLLDTLAVDSTPTSLTPAKSKSHPVYRSLLVSAGKGHKNYLNNWEGLEEDTALRERNDAHQLMVWGFRNTQVH